MKGADTMALIKCPECGREDVSDSAQACPQCGRNIANKEQVSEDSLKAKGAIIVRFLAVVFAIVLIISGNKWYKGREEASDIKDNIKSTKSSIHYSDMYSDNLSKYANFVADVAIVERLEDELDQQERKNTIALIFIIVSAICLVICFILC